MSPRAVVERLALLQFPLLFLPALIVTLAVYGSEFELTSGRLIAGLLVWLPIQGLATRPLARRVAGNPLAWSLVCVGVALLVSWAYRPLHFAWWDERSIEHALRLAPIGVASLFLSTCAAARVRASGAALSRGLPGALVLSALPWLASQQHANFVFFGVALAAAAGLAAGPAQAGQPRSGTPGAPALPQGVLLWALAQATLDLSLPVWERNLEGGFGADVALALGAAALGAAIPQARRIFLAQAAPSFVAACLMPAWVLNPAHQVFAGLALGAALGGLASPGRRASLAAVCVCIGVAWLAANGLTQNLAFAPARAVFVLVPAWLWWRARPAAKM